ncbi:HAMP domain-containing sensor histidine kinase [Kribbella sp. NPDC005582]|uniref:sensor histidine kinase n=1 Tax=Kribbella sp. NPDC005582 TaxID=3156893 RepID=UPI0033B56A3F
MTAPPIARRSLQTRLALAYATGIYAAGVVVLLAVFIPLTGAQSVAPEGRPRPGVITGTGSGLSLPQTLTASAVALVVLIPVALALGWFVAGRFLRPLRAITAAAKVISTSDLHQRLDLGEPTDELTELGHTLDDLFTRLQASFDAQRHFVANASHELRTPLAGLRTLLEVALADPAADAQTLRTVCREALALGEHQERIVEALLVLATSERGTSRRDPIDLSQVVERVLATRHDHATQRGIRVAVQLSPAPTTGDPRLIESLVANLIDNAIRHNHPHGHVTITTALLGNQPTLTVTNTGPPVPPAEVQSLFAPFHKQSAHPEGHGLGLAIVNAVAQAHQATLTTTPHPQGGLTITTHFPQLNPKTPAANLTT